MSIVCIKAHHTEKVKSRAPRHRRVYTHTAESSSCVSYHHLLHDHYNFYCNDPVVNFSCNWCSFLVSKSNTTVGSKMILSLHAGGHYNNVCCIHKLSRELCSLSAIRNVIKTESLRHAGQHQRDLLVTCIHNVNPRQHCS